VIRYIVQFYEHADKEPLCLHLLIIIAILQIYLWSLITSLPVVAVFVDVLQQIKVNITVISLCNLDTVRNIDRFCQFGHIHPIYFLTFLGASVYCTVLFGFVSKCNADRSRYFG